MDRVPYGHNLVVTKFSGYDWASEPLLVLGNSLRRLVPIKHVADFSGGRASGRSPAATFLYFLPLPQGQGWFRPVFMLMGNNIGGQKLRIHSQCEQLRSREGLLLKLRIPSQRVGV